MSADVHDHDAPPPIEFGEGCTACDEWRVAKLVAEGFSREDAFTILESDDWMATPEQLAAIPRCPVRSGIDPAAQCERLEGHRAYHQYSAPARRFEVRPLLAGGWAIVDITFKLQMIGPYPKGADGRRTAEARAAQFEADPSAAERVAAGEEVPLEVSDAHAR